MNTPCPRHCLAGALIACALPAWSQTNGADSRGNALEEVIVTAQKQDESIQKTPISLAAFNETHLENLGVTNLSNIQAAVPNLSMRQMPSSKSAMRTFIRGIGNNDAQITQDPAIAVYADGVYIARSTGLTSELADVERIEVLRGPQGTLYGRNATGGAINIISKRPSGSFGVRQELTFGNRDLWRSRTLIDLPEAGHVSAKLAFIKGGVGGSVRNTGPGWDFGREKKEALRIALRWEIADNLSANYAFDWSQVRSGMSYQQTLEQPYPLYAAVPYARHREDSAASGAYFAPSDLKIYGHTLIVDWELNDTLAFKSLTGYRNTRENLYEDYGANPVTPRLFANDPFDTKNREFTQEFQFSGTLTEAAVDYVAGLYYFEEKGSEFTTDYSGLNFGGGIAPFQLQTRDTDAKNSAYAAYGQITWTPPILDDGLHFTLGARYSKDRREVDTSRLYALDGQTFSHARASKTFNKFSPSAIVAYDISQDANVYLKYTEGYRTGGFNGRATRAAGVVTPVDAETVDAYEIGVKTQWLDNRLRVNLALFQMNYDDLQLSFAAPNDVSDVRFFNVGKADISGAELDISAAPLPGLVATLSYGYLQAKLKDVVDPLTGIKPPNDFQLPSAPENSYSLDLEYTFAQLPFGTLAAAVNYAWRDDMATSTDLFATPEARLDSYGLLGARLTLSDIPAGGRAHLKAALWGRNLLDKAYLVDAVGAFQWSSKVGIYGEPRSYGVNLTYEF